MTTTERTKLHINPDGSTVEVPIDTVIGPHVKIGHHAKIGPNVQIEAYAEIAPYAEIGDVKSESRREMPPIRSY